MGSCRKGPTQNEQKRKRACHGLVLAFEGAEPPFPIVPLLLLLSSFFFPVTLLLWRLPYFF